MVAHEQYGGFEALIAALCRPEAFPQAPQLPITTIQTHASAVLLADNRVYKLKKPKNFGFFDYSTPEQRRYFCLEEVRLNARLAPQVYLGVAPVLASAFKQPSFGPIFGSGDLPEPGALVLGASVIDYAVVMKRLPDEATLEARIHNQKVDLPLLTAVAERVADFHRSVQTNEAISRYGELATIRGNWEENFEQMRPYIGRVLDASTFDAIATYARRFMARRQHLFAARLRDGCIRDCHGDLRLQHIYCLPGLEEDSPVDSPKAQPEQIDIIDCIEFNERFRFGDVAGEVAFLAMELDEANRPDLARHFTAAYVAASDDEALRELLPFYCCYRACVRGKVLAFLLDEPEVPPEQQESARRHARVLFDLAASYACNPTSPTLLMIGGVMGTGKSTLATRVAEALGWKVIASDQVRKRLAGMAPSKPQADTFGAGLYTAAWTARTYHELLQQATQLLSDSRSVILDASFSQREHRQEAAELAARMGARPIFAECCCSRDVVLARLAQRWSARNQPEESPLSAARDNIAASDGRPELYDAQAATWQPVTATETLEHAVISTDGTPDLAVEQVMRVLMPAPPP